MNSASVTDFIFFFLTINMLPKFNDCTGMKVIGSSWRDYKEKWKVKKQWSLICEKRHDDLADLRKRTNFEKMDSSSWFYVVEIRLVELSTSKFSTVHLICLEAKSNWKNQNYLIKWNAEE